MIIIEGPDNAGKTTLAKKLSKRLDLPMVHSVRPKRGDSPEVVLSHSNSQLQPQNAILDRVYAISEWVYGRVIRGKTALGHFHSQALLDLYHRPYLIIHCRPKMETILDNRGRDQMAGVIDNHKRIVEEYDYIMADLNRFSHCTVVSYDWESNSFDILANRCSGHLSRNHSRFTSVEYLTKFKDTDTTPKQPVTLPYKAMLFGANKRKKDDA